MKNLNARTILGPIIAAFKRYNFTIFIVVLVSGLAVAVLMLNGILQQSSDISGYESSLGSINFDQATIDKVKGLHQSTDTPLPEFTVPSGRISPFGE